MRIAILTTLHSPLDVRIFYKEAISLAEAGHEVVLFAPHDLSALDKIANAHITYVSLTTLGGKLSRPLRWLHLSRLLQHYHCDVWHFHDPELLPLAIIWKNLYDRNVKLIYDVHEDVPKDVLDKLWIPRLLRKPTATIVDKVERWGLNRCDLAIAATDSIGKRVASSAKKNFIVRNYPLVIAQQGSALRPNKDEWTKVIYCGNLTEQRGIKMIVQAMDSLQEYKIKLTLLGLLYPEQFGQEIHQIAGENVEIIAKVPFEQVARYLTASDIGIVCFQPGPNHLEALPTKLFEYMQAGLPVIASDFPLWRQIVEDAGCGVLVDPSKPEEIAQAILQLANDPSKCQAMGEAGMKAIEEKYSWKCESQTLLQAYQAL